MKNQYVRFYVFSMMFFYSCRSLFVQEPASEYNIRGEVIALVTPDTVKSDTDFDVQISFPIICGGTYSGMYREVSRDHIKLSPVIHVVAERNCPPDYFVHTVTSSVRFSIVGRYIVIAGGRFGDVKNFVEVVSHPRQGNVFNLRFTF